MKIKIDPNWAVDFPENLFIKPFQMRLDLSDEGFSKWREWFFEEFVKCDMWSCIEEGDYHAIQDMCGCSSIYETYRRIADKLPEIVKPNMEAFYPLFDPLQAYHLPASGWVNFKDGKNVPIEKDELQGWDKYFPKRSCVNCTGRYGDNSNKICSHDPEDDYCDDDCYDRTFGSWCPLMNEFMGKKGWVIDKSLEKYAGEPELRVLPSKLAEEENLVDLTTETPKIIKDFLKIANETNGEDDEHRRNSSNN